MIIKETAITKTQNLKENGEINYTLFSQPMFNTTMINLNLGVNYYKANKEQFEKDLLNFIQYTILGYTSDSVTIIETEQEIKEEVEYIEDDIDNSENNVSSEDTIIDETLTLENNIEEEIIDTPEDINE